MVLATDVFVSAPNTWPIEVTVEHVILLVVRKGGLAPPDLVSRRHKDSRSPGRKEGAGGPVSLSDPLSLRGLMSTAGVRQRQSVALGRD